MILVGLGLPTVAQDCSCVDCPLVVPQVGSDETCIDISGLTNGTLNVGGQGVCEIFVDFQHTSIADINMSLIAPDGSSVDLVFNTFGGATTGQFWQVTYLPCAATPVPDPGFPAVFPSDGWQDGTVYTGSYYPGNGCFEDLTGPANGTWCLFVQDPFIGDVTVINDWSITFCDDDGIMCGANTCMAEGGVNTDLDDTNYCVGDPLDNPVVNGASTDPDYGYNYTVFRTFLAPGEEAPLLIIDPNPDITDLPAGGYVLCGFSYLLADAALLPTVDGTYDQDQLQADIDAGLFCADIPDFCIVFQIDGVEEPELIFPDEVCIGDLTSIVHTNYDPSVTYQVQVVSGSFSTLDTDPADITFTAQTDLPVEICVTALSPCGDQTTCANITVNNCSSCQAEGGTTTLAQTTYCEGDPDLLLDIIVTGQNTDPEYGFLFSVTELGGAAPILFYTNAPDLTSFSPGIYNICGFSYLLADAPLITPVDGVNTPNDLLNDIQAEVFCGDLSEVCINVFIEPTPPLTFEGPTEVCPGVEYTYSITDWDPANGTYGTSIIMGGFNQFINIGGGQYSVIWSDATSMGEICATLTSSCGQQEDCLSVTIGSGPDLVLSNSTIACVGQLLTVTWIEDTEYTYTAYSTSGSFSTFTQSPGTLTYVADTDGDIEICVDAVGPCGTITECTQISADLPPVAPELDFPASVCYGEEVTVTNTNWDVDATYLVNPSCASCSFTLISAQEVVFTAFSPTTDVSVCFEIFNACGSETSCADIVVDGSGNADPMITGELNTCYGEEYVYTATNLAGVDSYSWSVDPNEDSFIVLENDDEVTVGLVDPPVQFSASICLDYTTDCGVTDQVCIDITPPDNCDGCESEAGIIAPGQLIESCEEEDVVVTNNGDAVFDSDDGGIFIIHTDQNDPVGSLIATSTDGVIPYDLLYGYNVVYYVTYAVGNDIGGTIDFSDVCLSLSNTVPFEFYEPIGLQSITSVPIGDCATDWDITVIDNWPVDGTWFSSVRPPGESVFFSPVQGDVTTATFTGPGTYVIDYLIANDNCSLFVKDTIEITAGPEVTNIEETCVDASNYEVSFDIGGGSAPYQVNGVDVGSGQFLSDLIPAGNSYSFTILDANGCEVGPIAGDHDCACESDAGTVAVPATGLLTVCEDFIVVVTNGDEFLDANDNSVFLLHTDASDALGSTLVTSVDGTFSFGPPLQYGSTYYVSHVVGDATGLDVDLSDPCLSVSPAVALLFVEPFDLQGITVTPLGSCENVFTFSIIQNPNIPFAGLWSVPTVPPGGGVDIVSVQDFDVDITFTGSGTYEVQYFIADGLCSDIISVTVVIEDAFIFSDPTYVCDLTNGTYTVSYEISGSNPPFTVGGSPLSSTLFTSAAIPSGNSYSFEVADANGCTTELLGTHECECTSEAGTMSSDLLEVCGDDDVTVSGLGDELLDNNDNLVYILHTSPTAELGTLISTSENGVFQYEPAIAYGVIYYVSAVVGDGLGTVVDLTDECLSIALGQPIIFYEEPAVLTLDVDPISSCGQEFTLTSTTTVGQVAWTTVSTPSGGSVAFTSTTDNNTSVTVDVPGTYTVQVTVSNGPCTDDQEITFDYQPTILQAIVIDYVCSADGSTYQAVVQLSGGTEPYTVNNQQIIGDVFTSQSISSGDGDLLTVSDAEGCQAAVLPIAHQCPTVGCESDAGSMDLTLLEFCVPEFASIQNLGDETLDANDDLVYVMHTLPGNVLGDIIVVSPDGTFPFLPGMEYGVTYYISAVVGNSFGSIVDLEDACLSVAPGQPVVFYEPVGFDDVTATQTDICQGEFSLMAEPTAGFSGAWQLVASPPGSTATITSPADDTTGIEVTLAGNYSVEYAIANGTCMKDTMITFSYSPSALSASISEVSCSGDGTYETTIMVTDGVAPYTVNGVVLADSVYNIPQTASGDSLQLVIVDATLCDTVVLTAYQDCGCVSDAGMIITASQQYCDTTAIVQFTVVDTMLDADDVGLYIIYTDPSDPFGSQVAQSSTGLVSFADPYQLDQVYYISYIVGDMLGLGVDQADPCLSVSNQSSFVYQQCNCFVSVTIGGATELCEGSFITMPVQVDGPLPIVVTIIDEEGQQSSYDIVQPSDTVLNLPGTATTSYTIVDVTSGLGCQTSFGGLYEVSIVLPPVPVVEPQVSVCNLSANGSVVVLSEQVISTDIPGEWTDVDGNVVTGSLDFDGLPPGIYAYTYSTTDFLPCEQQLSVMVVTVEDCTCPDSLLLGDEVQLCEGDYLLDLTEYFVDSVYAGQWSIGSVQGEGQPIIDGQSLVISSGTVGQFELVFTAEGLASDCDSIATLSIVISELPMAGMPIAVQPEVCAGDGQQLILFDYLVDYDLGGVWTTTGELPVSAISGIVNTSGATASTYIYEYTVEALGNCADASSTVMLSIVEPAEYFITPSDPICFGAADGSIEVLDGDGLLVEDIMVMSDQNVPADPQLLSAGVYLVTVIDSVGCTWAQSVELQDPLQDFLDLGDDITVPSGAITTLTPVLNTVGTELALYEWFVNEAAMMSASSDTLLLQPEGESLVQLIVTDEDGCITSDDLLIQVLIDEVPVILANAFDPSRELFRVEAFAAIDVVEQFAIYDRWGNLVYLATDYDPATDNRGWDGSMNGLRSASGVYVYKVQYRTTAGDVELILGDVTVLGN